MNPSSFVDTILAITKKEGIFICTAIRFASGNCYFGRNLDWEHGFGERVVITPRRYPFRFRSGQCDARHHAMIGMAKVLENYPLYFDAVNEFGLAMAGMNFHGNACYQSVLQEGVHHLATFELIPYLLGKCRSLREAKRLLESIHITDTPFTPNLPVAELHWMLADREGSAVLEVTTDGLQVYDDPVDLLTNNPPFPMQLHHLSRYRGLSPCEEGNRFAPQISMPTDSRGTGAVGLPGDFSSVSRFVRGAFCLQNAHRPTEETAAVHQCFHILSAVEQVEGCVQLPTGNERTQYSACCNLETGVYYYRTYEHCAITAVRLFAEDIDGAYLSSHPLSNGDMILTEAPFRR